MDIVRDIERYEKERLEKDSLEKSLAKKEKEDRLKLSGQRLRQASYEKWAYNWQFSQFVDYEYSGRYLSEIFAGKKKMSDWRIKKVAEEIGWRYEYLAGLDDWQTEEDRLQDPAVIADAQKVILYQMGMDPASLSEKDRAFLFQMMMKMGKVIAEDLTAKK